MNVLQQSLVHQINDTATTKVKLVMLCIKNIKHYRLMVPDPESQKYRIFRIANRCLQE